MHVTDDSFLLRALQAADIPACDRILGALPDWFGLEASNRAYIERLRDAPAVVAIAQGEIVGFLALTVHARQSVEIDVMAVQQGRHRQGIGRSLVHWAEAWCRARAVPWLHVKTRGPSTPDPGYERTRHFYLALGFVPLFESLSEWGPENAALVLVKHLGDFDPPAGFHSVTPRLVVRDAPGLVRFMRAAFGATGVERAGQPVELSIGDSIVMVSEAGVRPATSSCLYVYVPDADETWRAAVAAGARALEPPFDTPYGDRRGMVEDQWGNVWQIATRRSRGAV
jgi:uncharacterized glyoxalase superfamily protein PhnB/GNAT superfamily N-acetyltransferase